MEVGRPICRPLKRPLLLALLGALALLSAPSASAGVQPPTFYLDNNSSAQMEGNWQWGPPQCVDGAWASGSPYTLDPGESADAVVGGVLGCPGSGVDPVAATAWGCFPPITSEGDCAGERWTWTASYAPDGASTLTCSIEQSAGSNSYTAEVDGLTCDVADASATPAASLESSAAPVRSGDAIAAAQLFPGQTTAAAKRSLSKSSRRGRYEIVLRDRHGQVHGRTEATIIWGHQRTFPVPIDGTLKRRVAEHGFAKMKATLKRIDGKPGRGDRATLTVMRDRRNLPF